MTAVTMAVDTAAGTQIVAGIRLAVAGYAWTPNDWQNTPPDAGMVRVLWEDDRQPLWEYEWSLSDAPETADQPRTARS